MELIITDNYRILYSYVLKKKTKQSTHTNNNTNKAERVMEKPQNCIAATAVFITYLHIKINWHRRIQDDIIF
jgi:hypothetical protein